MMKRLVIVVLVMFVVVMLSSSTDADQGMWGIGLYGGVYGPTGELEKIAETGFGGGLGLGYWFTDSWLAGIAASYHLFGEKKLLYDTKIQGGFAPIDLFLSYYLGSPGMIRFYITGRGGAYIGTGDFEETDWGVAAGVGLDFPINSAKTISLVFEPDYYWIFAENDTLSYWGLNLGLSFAFGGGY